MARYRLSRPAQADLTQIPATSAERWGIEARRRYAALLAAAMRRVAADPETVVSQDRSDMLPGLRSFHLRHARDANTADRVRRPAHILYYRPLQPDLVEIVRILHERRDPRRHLLS
jgi:toxin ParE1/3/4